MTPSLSAIKVTADWYTRATMAPASSALVDDKKMPGTVPSHSEASITIDMAKVHLGSIGPLLLRALFFRSAWPHHSKGGSGEDGSGVAYAAIGEGVGMGRGLGQDGGQGELMWHKGIGFKHVGDAGGSVVVGGTKLGKESLRFIVEDCIAAQFRARP